MAVASQRGGVSEDTTLDAFADDADTRDADTATGSSDVDPDATDTAGGEPGIDADDEDGAVSADPVPVTSAWRANATCSACGEPAARRWRDDDERVCVECASWTTTGRGACDQ